MRGALLLPALLAVGACAAPPGGGRGPGGDRGPGGGGGIVSLNPCVDAMLVRLVPASRIAAISHYSQEPGATSIPLDLARRFRATAGTAEEVIALSPDLVIGSRYTAPATRDAFARAGVRTLYLDMPATIADSEAQIRQVAAAAGAGPAGERMVAGIERGIAAVERPGMTGRKPAALLYVFADLATGAGTLLDALMTRAGFRNAAADYGLAGTGTLPAEMLVAHPPAVVIAPHDGRIAALRRRLLPHTVAAAFPRHLIDCGGPTIVPALRRLVAIRATLA